MADTYPNFATLEQHERAGIDYGVLVRREEPAFAIIAPHGGGIEPGTSEIADAIACQRWSFYAFEGLKRSGNRVLHITSTCFDEPMCLILLGDTNRVVTIHGEESDDDGEGVFVGGLDDDLGTSIGALSDGSRASTYGSIRTPTCRVSTLRISAIEARQARVSSWSCRGRCERRCSNHSHARGENIRQRDSRPSSTRSRGLSSRREPRLTFSARASGIPPLSGARR